MSILPELTKKDEAMLAREIVKTEDQETYVRCDHKDGGISYWRFIRSSDLVQLGDYAGETWVVVVIDGPGIPREGYPMDKELVPENVRKMRQQV